MHFPRVNRHDLLVYFLRVEIQIINTAETLHDCVLRVSGLRDRRVIRSSTLSAVADL